MRACGVVSGVLVVLATGCSRGSAPAGDAVEASAQAAPAASASSPAPLASVDTPVPPTEPPQAEPPPPPPSQAAPAPEGEAKRTTVASLERDPLLRSQLARLRDHFGKDARGAFAVQQAGLAEGRVGVLVSRPDESDPIVLAIDPVGPQLLFAKDKPTAGITPPVLHTTIAPAPERGVAVFAYVESMHILAARMWADDANPYADIEVFHPDACDELSVAYRAGVGWIVACASKAGTRAQRLREDLTGAWGPEGVSVGTPSPVGRAQIAFDGRSRWTLVQRAKAVGGDRQLTYHYDADGQPLP